MIPPGNVKTSETGHNPIARRHSVFKRLVRRATSNGVATVEFATNAMPHQGLRLSTANLKVERVRLQRRRSSAPVTPRTINKRKRYLSTEGLSRMLSRDSYLRRSFEDYAAAQYALENVSFMERLLEWQTKYNFSYEEAVRMCQTFINDGAPLQINISYDSRTGIENMMADGEYTGRVPMALFDKAAAEITSMMQGGLWGSFVSRGGVDRAESIAEALERQSREYRCARSANSGYLVET
jgi:hypothetical protein